MSTYYRPTKPIPLRAIKINKNLKERGFEVIEDENGTYFHLEGNYIHYAVDKKNNVIDVFRYGGNNASKVLEPLEDEFEVDFISEYDEEYDDYCHPNTGVIKVRIGLKDVHQTPQERKNLGTTIPKEKLLP